MKFQNDLDKSKQNRKQNKRLALRLKRDCSSREIDLLFHEKHDTVFENLDCLDCANCCKTTSPIVLNTDITRIAKTLRLKPATFIESYLNVDEDGDFVFTSQPCPFLAEDNTCGIYDDRPKACREYPHTNRKNMTKILDLTMKNSLICPAVHRILVDIKKEIG